MLVSFITPTFGRCFLQPRMLAEVVHWLTRQTYADCEFLILNDAPDQTLVIDAPRVRVVNEGVRYPSLGAKMNRLVELARGEICLPQDDDDISLPWRAEQAVEKLKHCDYFSPRGWWLHHVPNPMVVDRRGVAHNCSAFRRNCLLGRYPDTSDGQDKAADTWARKNLTCDLEPVSDESVCYVYRWGVSPCHLSGHGPRANQAYAKFLPGPPGTFRIAPKMGQFDYLELRRQALE